LGKNSVHTNCDQSATTCDQHWSQLAQAAMPPISLRLLGTFQVLRDGAPVTRFRGDKVRALLAYLASEADRPHARAALAALFWPEQGDDLALRNLTQALTRLRAALGDEGTLLDSTREALRWRAAAWVDVQEFEQLARSTEAADLARAIELYGGEFLSGFSLPGCEAFEEWLLLMREQLHQLALGTLARLAEMHEQTGDYAALCASARQQLALEPWDEAAHRQLMRGLALAGDRSAALNQYERCREVLANELGVEPDVETRTLYERIRAEEFTPATRDVAAPRHNLPALLTSFVGREAELAELAVLRAQPDMRLLTLVGAGGMGKTRLALEIARASLETYADGVFFVPLASLATASELPSAVAQALDLALHGDPATVLLRFLRTKQLLLILDNFEHLSDGADLVMALLQEAPEVQIIATSRARLNVRGEQIYLVQGLEYAAEATPAEATTSPAMHLFVQAARRAQPSFNLSEANLPGLLQICRLVYGMPLGLELAAAWAEMLSLDEIAHEVERSAEFLMAEWADAPERQRSMRAVFDWSWRLLSESEQQVLCRLAVFRGGFTREAAEQVAGASLRVLTTLVHTSLLRRADGSATSTGRYQLHELLRQFAAEQLHALPHERVVVGARHSTFYLQFVAERERRLARNELHEAAAEIQRELDNVRQAWAWAAEHAQVAALEASAYGVWQFYRWIGLVAECQQIFRLASEELTAQCQRAGDDLPARRLWECSLSTLLAIQAHCLSQQGRYEEALVQARLAIVLGETNRNVEGEMLGYLVWGQVRTYTGHNQEARSMLMHAISLILGVHGPEYEIEGLFASALLAAQEAAYEQASSYAAQGLQLAQGMGYLVMQAKAQLLMGYTHARLERRVDAAAAYRQALAITADLGHVPLAAEARAGLASVALAEGDLALAQTEVEALLPILAKYVHVGLDEPFAIYLACYRVLDVLRDPRAAMVLQAGQRLLHEYADRIADDSLRRSFLENVATQQGKGAFWQRNGAILRALAATHLELHAGAVDPADLEVDAFADTQATGIDRSEAGVVGGVVDVIQNAPDLIDAEDDRPGLDGDETDRGAARGAGA
jgi:predicted ATPase/DNA-binding SARP family transcriptional activator